MRFLRQSLVGVFLLSMTLALLVGAVSMVRDAVQDRISREARVPPVHERVFAVNVLRAEAQTLAPTLTAYGQIESRRSLDLRAAVGGSVTELAPAFEEGGQVQAGQVLLRIDPSDAQAARSRAQTDLQDAQAEQRDAARALDLAKDELAAAAEQAQLRSRALQRQQDLAARGVGTTAAVEAAELAAAAARQAELTRRQALAQAEARVDQAATRTARAEIALAEAQRRLDDTTIRAEFSGTLSGVTPALGGIVAPNERLAQLVDETALEVAFRISTDQYARLLDANGALMPLPVEVALNSMGAGLVARGTLARDSAMVAQGQTGRLVFAGLDQTRGFKPGDFVTVRVAEPALENVFRLPATALAADGSVLVLGPEDRLVAMAVTLVRRQSNDVLVRAPDLAGREVVAQRTPLLGAGIKVRPLRQPDAGQQAAAPEAPEMLELDDAQRARLIAFVQGNTRMPAEIRQSLLARLQQPKVPAEMVRRLEERMGG